VQIPKDATNIIFDFVSGILRAIPNLNKLKVRLHLWDCPEFRELTTFANSHDFDDVAEQIFRPFSTIRVRQAEFVDKSGYPIRSALSLSRWMTSDTAPPPVTLHELFGDLSSFLDDSLSKQSRRAVNARLVHPEVACDQYDINTFRSTLRSLLENFGHFRGLVPPQHLVEFAQDSASAKTDIGRILDRLEDNVRFTLLGLVDE
jgi:hypothetical protein